MTHATPRLKLKSLTPLFACLQLLHAEQAPAPAATTGNDTAIELSPFEVRSERDVGYRATSSAAGSRMNEEIRNIPASVSVMTSDFLKDIGATDLLSASDYMVGGGYAPSAWIDFRGFNFRGIRTPITFRNMFSWFSISDNFSTDRIDIVRGPNSLLFGVAPAGGLANTTTKRAQFKNFVTLDSRIGSFNANRFTADINRQLGENVAVRLNLLWSNEQSDRNWEEEQRRGLHVAGTWRVFPKTTVRIEAEYLRRPKVVAIPLGRDAFSWWDGQTPFAYNSNPSTTTGLQRVAVNTATTSHYLFIAQRMQLLNARGWGQTTGPTGNASLPVKNESILPRESNFGGPDWRQDLKHGTQSITVEQAIGQDLHIELAASQSNHRTDVGEWQGMTSIRRDPNQFLPGTTDANPYYGAYYYEGQYSPSDSGNSIWEARASAIYDWHPKQFEWMQHKVFASTSRRSEHYFGDSFTERIANNPIPGTQSFANSNNRVFHRRYLSDGDTRQSLAWPGLINDPSGLRSELVSVAGGARGNTRGKSTLDSWAISASSAFWKGRIRSLIGQRQDSYTEYQAPLQVDPVTGIQNILPYQSSPSIRNVVAKPFYGLVLTPVSWFTLYGTKAESFAPSTSGLDWTGNAHNAVSGKGDEVGIRLSLPNDSVYLTIAKYKTLSQGNRTSVATAVSAANAIWQNAQVNRQDRVLAYGTTEETVAGTDGYEVELFTNLTKEWAMTMNYSLTDNEQRTIPDKMIAYINQYLPEWKQLQSTYPDQASAIGVQIQNAQNWLVQQIPGVKGVRNYKHNFNLFSKYRFASGPLKGLTTGVGVNYRSAPIQWSEVIPGGAGIVSGYGASRVIFNAKLGYDTRIGRYNWNISLNVNNLLNKDYFEELALNNVRYAKPRTWALTNTVRF